CVADLNHPAAAAILLLRLGRGHLLAEGDHGRGFFRAQQTAAPMLIAGTALRLQRTVLAVPGQRFITVEKVSRLVFVPAFVAQVLVARTNIVIVRGIVDEDRGGETSRAGVVFLRAAFAQAADIIDPQLSDRLDAATVGVISISQHLSRLASQAGSDASYGGRELFAVVGGLRHFHVYDQRLRGIGRDLHVVVGRDAAIGLPHSPRFRFTHTDPRSRFAGTQFLQFFQSLLQPLLPFASRSSSCLFHPARLGFLIWFSHFSNPSPRSFQVLFDLRLA